jgi:anaerobic selenocysteine-containing dehydrogenase
MDRILKPRVSRRTFLNAGAAAGGAILAFGSSARAASAKVAKETVNYQPSPRGAAHCSACAYFQAPSSCNFVNGQISPSGWCVLFKPK